MSEQRSNVDMEEDTYTEEPSIELSLEILLDNKVNLLEVVALFDKKWLSAEVLQDFISYYLANSKDIMCEDVLVDVLLVDITDTQTLSEHIDILRAELENFLTINNDIILLVVLKWTKDHKILFDNYIEFREYVYEIIRIMDFPKPEVDYFLNRFLVKNIDKEVEVYVRKKEISIRDGIPFDEVPDEEGDFLEEDHEPETQVTRGELLLGLLVVGGILAAIIYIIVKIWQFFKG